MSGNPDKNTNIEKTTSDLEKAKKDLRSSSSSINKAFAKDHLQKIAKPEPGETSSTVPETKPNVEMEKLAELVAQLAQAKLDAANRAPLPQAPPPPRVETLCDVIKRASSGIIEFKRTNLTNFLASVEMHYDATGAAHRPQVIKIAQQKVTGSTLIETSDYQTFAAFRTDVLANFKPAKPYGQLEYELSTLTRKKDETIDSLAKRALSIKVKLLNLLI